MRYKHYKYLIIFPLILTACVPQSPATEIPPVETGSNSIGTIDRVSDTVQHNESQLSGLEDLFQNDNLRLFGGGEGILDFGSDKRLRMFNDTELGGVRTASDPQIPLIVKMTLFSGGFTGQIFDKEGKFEFDTPNGARIHVFGTTFVLAYDRDSRVTLCANFEGDIRIEAAGSGLVSIPPGEIYQVQAGGEPEYFADVPWTPAEYEAQARADQSPLIPFGDIPITGDESTDTPTRTSTPTPPTLEATTPAPSITFTPIYTPTMTPIPCPPKLTVVQRAFCREGPSQIYDPETGFEIGVVLDVEGRNRDDSWWWVLIPDSRAHCWISDVTVEMHGDSSCLDYINPPPTYTPTPSDTQPPVIQIIDYAPSSLNICDYDSAYSHDMTYVTASVSDESEIKSVVANWENGGQGYQVSMEKIDDYTYGASIGPVTSTGDLIIQIQGEDIMGNVGYSNSLYINVADGCG